MLNLSIVDIYYLNKSNNNNHIYDISISNWEIILLIISYSIFIKLILYKKYYSIY